MTGILQCYCKRIEDKYGAEAAENKIFEYTTETEKKNTNTTETEKKKAEIKKAYLCY